MATTAGFTTTALRAGRRFARCLAAMFRVYWRLRRVNGRGVKGHPYSVVV